MSPPVLPWAPAERPSMVGAGGEVGRGAPLTRLSLPPLPAPLQLSCLQSPHESPEPGAGQVGGRAVTGGGGRAPGPPGLQTQHCEGPVPPALGLLFVYSRVFNAWSCPAGGCPLFYFHNQKKKGNRRAVRGGEVVVCCCVPALRLGLRAMRWEGVSQGSCSPLQRQGSCPPSPVPRGRPGIAGRAGCWGRARQGCGAAGPGVRACGRSPPLSPPRWAWPLPPRAGGRGARGGRRCPALPAARSEPFSSQMLYVK